MVHGPSKAVVYASQSIAAAAASLLRLTQHLPGWQASWLQRVLLPPQHMVPSSLHAPVSRWMCT
jgi:hypothetical protein